MIQRGDLARYIPTSSFSSVMGIGIVSDALLQLRLYNLSQLLEYSDLAVYLGLVILFLLIFLTNRKGTEKTPLSHFSVLGSFTFVAGTAVLATRLSESGFIIIDIPAIVICLIFIAALACILALSVDGSVFIHVQKPYLFFVPFIALLGISVLASQTFSKLNTGYPYLLSISLFTWATGFAGTSIFIIYTIIKFRKKFFRPDEIDGFYFIYSGIASLIAFSGILMIKLYNLNNQLLISFLRYVASVEYIWAVMFSILLFFIYSLKIAKGSIEFRHRVTIWGSVFPMGVDSMGSYFISLDFHIHFIIYLSYFYAFTGVMLIAVDLIEIVMSNLHQKPVME